MLGNRVGKLTQRNIDACIKFESVELKATKSENCAAMSL